ncbi:MAG: ATP-binding cassette domain-containing protein [Acidimicrobiales bacterium]
MTRLPGLLRLELGRSLRDLRYLVLAIASPVAFYLLFAGIFSGRTGAGGLPAQVEIMVAMAVFGGMWGALSATAPRLARDRDSGWLQGMRLTPFRPVELMAARVLAGALIALPALVCVGITAALVQDVRLAPWQWLAGLGLVWAGTLPFVALGIAIGATTGAATAYALTTALYFGLAALGGLWVPPAQFSPTLRHVAMALPSYEVADLAWRVAGGSAPMLGDGLALLCWTAGLTALAVVLSGRRRRRRSSEALGPSDEQAAVSMSAVSTSYGPLLALDHLDLRIERGATVALLGPNGAGTSTAIAALLGQLATGHGSAQLFGESPAKAVAEGWVGVMLQDGQLMDSVRVGTLVSVLRRAYRQPAGFQALVEAASISELLSRRTDRLSVGQAQRVRFALAAAGDPRLLVLDEPTVAMDVEARAAFWEALQAQTARGRTVIFSTHYLEEADTHADRIVVLRAGRVVADGTPEEIKAAAGVNRSVRFTTSGLDPGRFEDIPGVVAVQAHDSRITLHTTDPDATIWALYDFRRAVHDLEITGGDLQEAFLALTVNRPGFCGDCSALISHAAVA